MITCDIIGYSEANSGLGNQLFIVATTEALAKRNNDVAVYPDLFKKEYSYYGNTIFHKLNKGKDKAFVKHYYNEPPFTSTIFNEIKYQNNLCLKGHFVSYKYFEDCEEHIKGVFSLPDEHQKIVDNFSKNIDFHNTVCLHIRRGDYLNLSNYHTNLGLEYYENALKKFDDINNVFIFSDDIDWCKANVKFKNKNMLFSQASKEIHDLFLMSKFQNFIIANSTFSWWGAYLSNSKNKKIIAPKEWFGISRTKNNSQETADLIPPNWIRI